MSAYTEDFAKQTAARLPFIRGSKEAAIAHLQARLDKWTGDSRRDGDTPKEFWENVMKHLKEGN